MTESLSLKDIKVYKESLELIKLVVEFCKNPMLQKEYWICDQLKRAAISICISIAEGYGRRTKKDFA